MYTPPFTISAKAVHLVADISTLLARCIAPLSQSDKLKLRRVSRIKTIHSSLAIEGNRLSENEVRDVLDGKLVAAPPREIQEVENAIAAYDLYPKLNPWSAQDMLLTHGLLMRALCNNAGQWRRGGVGVFAGRKSRLR